MKTSSDEVYLRAPGRIHRLSLKVADTFGSRFRGLMLSPALTPGTGLLLKQCASVHTAFMRYPIDLAYVNDRGLVLQCVAALRPWRANAYRGALARVPTAARPIHTLEMAAGELARIGIEPGDRIAHDAFKTDVVDGDVPTPRFSVPDRQRGAAMLEFAVVGPLLTLLGLASVQYGLLFNAKNLINHASFMAARAGSTGNAKLDTVEQAYLRGLIPLYGGGRTVQETGESLAKATADMAGNVQIELLNPTRESFDDWNDPRLQALFKTGGKRVIPHRHLAHNLNDRSVLENLGNSRELRDVQGSLVKPSSGQSLEDANIIKLRITHGYEPKVPLVGRVYAIFLKWLDVKDSAFETRLIESGRVPVVSHVTLQMQTDPIETTQVSIPGMGNGGQPVDPGDPPVTTAEPPRCQTIGCSEMPDPTDPGGGGSNGPCKEDTCPVCTGTFPLPDVQLDTDLLFNFNESALQPEGRAALDRLIQSAKDRAAAGELFSNVKVIGHTDQIGEAGVNQQLSVARAKAVSDYLRSHGFPSQAITHEGRGANEPVVPLSACSPKTGQALIDCLEPNRRVVIQMTGTKT
ncbi:MAG: OmpA family protein [Pseudomonadota bacterium]